jgi:hypothetical protein
MGTVAVLVIVVVNNLLASVFRALVAFEGHETRTGELTAHCSKLFGFVCMGHFVVVCRWNHKAQGTRVVATLCFCLFLLGAFAVRQISGSAFLENQRVPLFTKKYVVFFS